MLKKILFSEVTSIIKTGQKKPLELHDIPELPELWNPDKCVKDFHVLDGNKGGRELIYQILSALRPQAKKLLVMILVMLVLKMLSPILIHRLIESIGLAAKGELSLMAGMTTALLLCLVQLSSALLGQHYIYHAVTSTQSAINGINQRICKAILRSRKSVHDKGQVINRTGSDAELAGASLWALGELVQISLTAIATGAILFSFIGSAAIAPLVLLALLMPLSRWFSSRFAAFQSGIMKSRDERVTKMSQYLSGIKVIKSFVWEQMVRKDIAALRSQEKATWGKFTKYKAISNASYLFASLSVSLLAFGVYMAQGNVLTAAKAFTCLALFSYLEPCFRQLPKILGEVTSAFVAADRIAEVIKEGEQSESSPVTNAALALSLSQLSVDYPQYKNALQDIGLEIEKGSSIAVIGPVGSGKSTLLKAILGEVEVRGCLLKDPGMRSGYVPQDPFLFHGSLAENIHLGNREVSDEELETALHATCLDHDLEHFPGGLLTEIGEGGGNLSGGQKQRVNLARAACHPGELLLLDDPLSALDPNTEKEIINRLIFGEWNSRTRIVTTHRLAHLGRFDRIVLMDKGRVMAQGTYQELKQNADFIRFCKDHEKEEVEEITKAERKASTVTKKTPEVKVIEDEAQKTGEVALSLYWDYFKAMAGFSRKHYARTFSLLALTALGAMSFPIFQNTWLSRWTQSLSGNGNDLFFLGIYALTGIGTLIVCSFQHFYWSRKAIDAAEALHHNALEGVLSTPLRFFDANPSGRILNRFSRDLDAVERDLSWSLEDAVMASLNSLGAVFVMIIALPFMALLVLPVIAVYWFLQRAYRTCMRETKRLQAQFRSPRISSIQEVLDGALVIRCYHAEEFFQGRFGKALSDYQKAFYGVVLINRWFSIRIPLVSSLLSLAAACGVILMGRYGGISEGIAGMALMYAFRFWDSLNWTVRAFGEAEAQMTSVERLESLSKLAKECTHTGEAVSQPIHGEIHFKNVFARYAPHLPDVLKGTDFKIAAGSKVGFIGRTGAGKSTLFSLLHRFIDCNEGTILIDNQDINKFPLGPLRESIVTIPQNPILFSGTIRQNLDPLSFYSDKVLLQVLKKAHVDFLQHGLETRVSEGGSNFSRGQKQLLCLARALVRKSQIIVVDEATASVDAKTDSLIREILMNECPEVTVLIIAHKLESVSECDMIIEMRDGKVLETTFREGPLSLSA